MSYSQLAQAYMKKLPEIVKGLPIEWNPLETANPQEDIFTAYKEAYTMDAYHVPAILVRGLCKSHMRFYNAAKEFLSADQLKMLPFVVAHPKNPTLVYVYDNLEIDRSMYGKADQLKVVSFAIKQNIIQPTVNKILTARKEEGDKAKAYTKERLFRTLRRRKELTISKLLAAHFLRTLTSAQIRDIALSIEELLAPVELILADTPEKVVEMYATGPSSCMHPQSEHSKHWRHVFHADKLHPAMYYLHNPRMVGAYYKRKGAVAARAILMKDENGKMLGYVHAYPEKQKQTTILIQELGRIGADKYLGKKWGIPKEIFAVPGYWSNHVRDYVCPIPWLDMYPDGHKTYVAFNVKDKTFTVSYDEVALNKLIEKEPLLRYTVVGDRTQMGFVYAKKIINTTHCDHCGCKIVADIDGAGIGTVDGKIFCSWEHAKISGYVEAMMNDGHFVVKSVYECVEDALKFRRSGNYGDTYYYNNLEVLRRQGALPYVQKLGTSIDHTKLTINTDYWCIYANEKVVLERFTHAQLTTNKIPGWRIEKHSRVITKTALPAAGKMDEELKKLVNW